MVSSLGSRGAFSGCLYDVGCMWLGRGTVIVLESLRALVPFVFRSQTELHLRDLGVGEQVGLLCAHGAGD